MACNTVVIVSNQPEMRASLEALVRDAGLATVSANSLEQWLASGTQPAPACWMLWDSAEGDLATPNQIAMLAGICATHRVMVLAHSGDVPTAVQAIRQGAVDVIQKPFEQHSLLERIKQFVATAS